MKALILAAGYGTRLYPYTKNLPKPLLKVNSRPIIEYLIDKIEPLPEVSTILVVTNGKFYPHFLEWSRQLKISKPVRIINDLTLDPEHRLGAIRDMSFVFEQVKENDDYLVLGGDNFFSKPLGDFLSFCCAHLPAISVGVTDVLKKSEAKNYGVVKLDAGDRISEFREKPEDPETTLAAMCLYYFPKEKLGLINNYLSDPANNHDALGAYIRWLVENDTVYGYRFRELWIDIGRIKAYRKLKELLKPKG